MDVNDGESHVREEARVWRERAERLQATVDVLEIALEIYADPQYWNKDGTHAKGLGPGIAKRAIKALKGEVK